MPFAKEVVSLDDLSRGRFTLGLGAGGGGWDATMLGQEPWAPTERAERFAELVECLDVVLREPAASYAGRYYVADEARTYPGCVQQPRVPFAIAATGPAGMRLAAQHAATWVTTGDRTTPPPVAPEIGAPMIAAQIARLEAACADVGRDPSSIDRLVLMGAQLDEATTSPQALADTIGAYAEVGVTDLVVHWPRPEPPYEGDVATFEAAVAACMRAD